MANNIKINHIRAVVISLCAMCVCASQASAQGTPDPLPQRVQVDTRGVDLISGYVQLTGGADVSIGPLGSGGLSYSRVFFDQGWRGNTLGTVSSSGTTFSVSLGGSADVFSEASGTFTDDDKRGATLVRSTSPQGSVSYTYTSADGVVAVFEKDLTGGSGFPATVNEGVLTQVTSPNGEITSYHYKTITLSGTPPARNERLQSVTNNFGYQLHFEYERNTATSQSHFVEWRQIKKITAINRAVDYCSNLADSCSGFTESWPTVSYSYATVNTDVSQPSTVTDAEGRITTFTYNTYGRIATIKRPTSSSANVTFSYESGPFGKVTAVNLGYGTWAYGFVDASGERTATVTDPASETYQVVSDLAKARVKSMTDETNRTTSYTYTPFDKLSRINQPEGNSVEYFYDIIKGHLLTETRRPKLGSGLGNVVINYAYPSSCTNPVLCYKPITVTDARGKVTNYEYDATHGGVTKVTAPAPSSGAVRPETRFTYVQKNARYKSGASTFVNGPAIYLLAETSACATTASCNGTADETITTVTYPGSGVAQNLQASSIETAAGDLSVSTSTSFTYDPFGNQKSLDGPLAGTADTTYFHFNAARQSIGVVGPDPDGSGGPLKYRATRVSYNGDGQPYLTEVGTVSSQTSAIWDSTFSVLSKHEVFYDSYARVKKSHQYDGNTATVLGLTQSSYDILGRVECTVVRMNPASFSAPPTDACTLAPSGMYGQDRISKIIYDEAGRPTKTIIGVGTAVEQTASEIVSFTNNGLMKELKDADGNLTTYEYDGFDRVKKIRFPHPTNVGTSSTTDYEEFTYNSANEVLTSRRRDGRTIVTTYDDLGRVTKVNIPGTGPTAAKSDFDYTYDNFGRVKTAYTRGVTQNYSYDQLSRLTEKNANGVLPISYQYGGAGQRTQMTYPDGWAVNYAYDNTGAAKTVSHGARTLATLDYDNLGRVDSITYDNGTVRSHNYDGASRLSSLAHDLSGTTHDQTFGFSYNPAGQIVAQTSSNTLYDWSHGSDYTDTYADNKLNQYTSAGSSSISHDNNGNVSNDQSGFTYHYAANDNLISVRDTSSTKVIDTAPYADGMLRIDSGPQYYYDGDQEIAEYDDPWPQGGSDAHLDRRYIRMPGSVDAPFLMIDYTGTCGPTGCESWAHADIRGSVVAASDESGAKRDIYSYNAYGVPNPTTGFPFKYTGQKYHEATGLYYYKARWYDPEVGRFVGPDPIGYGDGMNMYAYVRNDPINSTDPTGLIECKTCWLAIPETLADESGTENDGGDEIVVEGTRRKRPDLQYNNVAAFINSTGGLDVQVGGGPSGPIAKKAKASGADDAGTCQKQPGDDQVVYAPESLFKLGPQGNPIAQLFANIYNGRVAERHVQSILSAEGLSTFREVTFTGNLVSARVDIVAINLQTSRYSFHEVKFNNARLTWNQRIVYPQIGAGTAIPRGGNAIRAGLTPFEPIGTDIPNVESPNIIRVCPA